MALLSKYVPVDDKAVEELAVANVLALHLIPLSADPNTADLRDGDIWYSVISGTHHIKARKNGSTVTLS